MIYLEGEVLLLLFCSKEHLYLHAKIIIKLANLKTKRSKQLKT